MSLIIQIGCIGFRYPLGGQFMTLSLKLILIQFR